MHRDTVTRSWGPLLCHSSTSITSCCSMIMQVPMLQGSVHNSWKLKTSQFLHGQHTRRTCHPLSMFGMLWIGVYDSRGVNRMVRHDSIRYRFSYPAIRYLPIPQTIIRFDSIQEYIDRYIDIIILYTYFKQPSTFLLILLTNATKIYNMNINQKMLLWAQC